MDDKRLTNKSSHKENTHSDLYLFCAAVKIHLFFTQFDQSSMILLGLLLLIVLAAAAGVAARSRSLLYFSVVPQNAR